MTPAQAREFVKKLRNRPPAEKPICTYCVDRGDDCVMCPEEVEPAPVVMDYEPIWSHGRLVDIIRYERE